LDLFRRRSRSRPVARSERDDPAREIDHAAPRRWRSELLAWPGFPVEAEPKNVTVSGLTRLDWEFVSYRFARDAADPLETYESKKQR